MNYRHSFHAGNFADVIKHIALVQIILHLQKKDSPFAVVDSHAGRGLYDLASDEAQKTGEAENGIARLTGLEGPEGLNTYLRLVANTGAGRYPGSPLIAARMLRPQDRLAAVEKHPEEFALLKKVLMPFARASAQEGDGYERLAGLLPPPERRGLVLMDPPFEAPDEFERAAKAVVSCLRRFATGIYLVWYPVKSAQDARAFCGEVLNASAARVLNIELGIDAPEGKLSRTGLLIVNPPFGFDGALRDILKIILPRLAGGTAKVEWLRGES